VAVIPAQAGIQLEQSLALRTVLDPRLPGDDGGFLKGMAGDVKNACGLVF
jgi:hypothetical protein